MSLVEEHHHPIVYKTYKARYFGLFAIVLLNIATTFVWLTYSSVPEAAAAYLNCSSFLVSVTSILYFFAYIIMAPISGWMFERHGIRKALFFGAGIQLVGSWLRYFGHFVESTPEDSTGRLAMTLVGQVIAAGAQPFFMNLPPKFAAVWFSEHGRTTATMIGTVSNASAAALAQLIIPIITDNTKPETMPRSVLFTAVLSVVAIIPVFFVADRPPTPPSPSAAEALEQTVEEPFHISLKKVGTNKQFLLLMIVFGSLVGIFNSLAVEITYPVTPASSTSILWAFGQLVAIVMLFTLQALQDDDLSARTGLNPPLIFNAVWCLVFATIPVVLVNSPYKRMEAEVASRIQEMVESVTDVKDLDDDKVDI
ncbi:hypothetical protein BGX29_003999 [Mortierella sp. GBA35]|nr:hypothetical protein BGX29_003999 [Mortierella sp. GBA35]